MQRRTLGQVLVYTNVERSGAKTMETAVESCGDPLIASREPRRDLQMESHDRESIDEHSNVLNAFKQTTSSDSNLKVTGGQGTRDPQRGGSRTRFRARRLWLIASLILAVGTIAPFAWNYLNSYESTDDAQIDGHMDPLSSRIDGTVIAVHAEDDDQVTKGQLLVEIDPRDYEVALEEAKAQIALADAEVASAKQNYAAALAVVTEDDAANFRAQRDARRYATLLDQQVVAVSEYDQYTAAARVSGAKVQSDREAAAASFKVIAAGEAAADAARAAVDQAKLNLSYTKIYAPANGIVGKRQVQLGSRIQPGQTLMFVTETDEVWVTANFKETQLARMRPGDPVTINVDTFGRKYHGYVQHMPGASGDRYSLLPPENATGNYVKVVQRLPVRILLEPGQDPDHELHPGMSVEPTVWLQQ